MSGRERRHDRVWLDATRGPTALTTPLDDEARAVLADWIARGRACVVRRRDLDAMPHVACLAIALPLARQRRRIGFAVERNAIVRIDGPLPFADALASAPEQRRPALRALADGAHDLATPLFVYGSFAWQAITAEPCVTDASDVDLLWDARDATQVARMFAVFARCETRHGLRVDGEVRFPDGAAVAWRELRASTARILVKRDDRVALEPSPLDRL